MAERRVGAESSATRALILEAAENLVRDEGHGAVSTRRVAGLAGLKPSLVHYYFPTTDDLWLAVFERGAAQSDAMIERALASDDPIRALWHFFADTSRTAVTMEFIALAIHRPALQERIARHSEDMRQRQASLVAERIGPQLAKAGLTAEALTLVLAGVGRALMMEGALGVMGGHDDARSWVDTWLDGLLKPA